MTFGHWPIGQASSRSARSEDVGPARFLRIDCSDSTAMRNLLLGDEEVVE